MAGRRFLGSDMTDLEVMPYFTWDAPMTVAALREQLQTAPEPERFRLLGKILREARDTDVWHFTTPQFVVKNFDKLEPHLGRRRPFWRWLLRRWREEGMNAVVLDLVRDRAAQGNVDKINFGLVRVDPPEEILANKLCTLLSRSELRDLVDTYALEKAGFRIENAWPLAQRKDGGLTAAQLGWVLSQIDLSRLPDGKVVLNGGSLADDTPTKAELQRYLAELSRRLLLLSPHP